MAGNLTTPINVPSNIVPTFDNIEVISIMIVNHHQALGELSPFSGNIKVGDTLESLHPYEKKVAIHYILTEADVIVHQDVLELDEATVDSMLATYPNIDPDLKSAVYQSLKDASVIPNDTVVV